MNFHPGIIALLLGSGLIASMMCYSSYEGVRIIRNWDIGSGSEYQLELERKTYLISTLMGYAMGFQLLSLFLFVFTADTLSHLFVGAMCAAGSLKVNAFGYPALIFKIMNCLLAGLWLIVNYTDNRAHDYPLIRKKYVMLLLITPIILIETILQAGFFLSLDPDIITSCCGIIFSENSNTLFSDLLALPLRISQSIFFLSGTITVLLALYLYLKNAGAVIFAAVSFINFIIGIAALISFISIYIYELPTHHCPFCLLHTEYNYVGYIFYLAALISGISGVGAGVIDHFKNIASLCNIVPNLQNKLALLSISSTSIFLLLAGYEILSSNLIL